VAPMMSVPTVKAREQSMYPGHPLAACSRRSSIGDTAFVREEEEERQLARNCQEIVPRRTSRMVRRVAPHKGTKDAQGRLTPFKDAPAHFKPNLTPSEMLRKGMHGGIYWNPKGGKPGIRYPRNKFPKGIPGVSIDEFPKEWFEGVPKELYLSRRYSTNNNCYKVKSGLDQAGWESSGWITDHDPRGWTQWYFRFYSGRRLDDGEDERQIGRWSALAGDKGRWKQNLIAKVIMQGASFDDVSVSPVVRQTLLHWAYELTEADFLHGAKRVRTHGATYVPRDQLVAVLAPRAKAKHEAERAAAAVADEALPTAQSAAEAAEARSRRAERRGRAEPASASSRTSGADADADADGGEERAPKRRRQAAPTGGCEAIGLAASCAVGAV